MEKWQRFLDSWATKGGQLLLLCFFVIILLALVIWITSRQAEDNQAQTVVLSTFSALSGALLGFLTGAAVGGQRKSDTPTLPPEPPKP